MAKLHLAPILITFITLTSLSLSSSQPLHLLNRHHHRHHYDFLSPEPQPTPQPQPQPKESLSLTPPLPNLPPPTPQCTLSLLSHSFADTMGQPPVAVPYTPPAECPPPWKLSVLHLSGEVSGEQYDRVAAVWLAGAEILRTTTPEPSENGTFWNVRKDITRYNYLLEQYNGSLSMMLENLVNDVFTGVYHVNLTILFYKDDGDQNGGNLGRKLGLGLGFEQGLGGAYEKPADMVIPMGSDGENGFWFRVEDESDVVEKRVEIPMNARRVVLEMYVSFHGDDEFWYSNPPTSYLKENNLSTKRGNGAYREVFVKIDGNVVGSEVPFPVVFTGGINPLFWDPVVAIGAFDLPSYEFDLTPFLGSLLDGASHSFELGVRNAIQFWLIDANLHVWLDGSLPRVEASVGPNQPPEVKESWEYEYKQLDGSFEIEAEKKSQSSGWVASNYGNLTTSVVKKSKFKNSIKFENGGTYKIVKQKVKVEIEVKVVSETGAVISDRSLKRKYPIQLITSTVPSEDKDLMSTNISHSFEEEYKEKSLGGESYSSIKNNQESGGWLLVKDHSVVSGTADTQQTLSYKSNSDCFSRSVSANNGSVVTDVTSVCSSIYRKALNKFLDTL